MPKKKTLYLTINEKTRDASFYVQWLRRAEEAQHHLQNLRAGPNVIAEQLERLDDCYNLDFTLTGIVLLANLIRNPTTFVAVDTYDAQLLALLSAVGLLIPTTIGYVLSIPAAIGQTDVERAIIFLAGTEDEDHSLHPENLLLCGALSPAQLISGGVAQLW